MMRRLLCAATLVLVSLCMVECQNSPSLASIQILPDNAALTYVGQTLQYKAVGTFLHAGHPSITKDVTSQVIWQTSNPSAATISNTGLATAVASGATATTAISATMPGSGGTVQGSTALTVSGQTSHDLTSVMVIPNATTPCMAPQCPVVTQIGEPTQFLAIGTFNTAPLTEDLTDQVTWVSSDVQVATINSTGLALANGAGITSITAIGRSNSGADVTGTSTLRVIAPEGGVQLPALTIYEAGLGNGTVTSSPAGINCTSGNGCTANFVLNATVTLTATPAAGSTFGGWSANCTPTTATTCSLVMNNNEPVGVIFNQAP